MTGSQPTTDYFRFCPGEEHIKLSNAICRGRRRTNFPKCNGCRFNDDQRSAAADSVVSAAASVTKSIGRIDDLFRVHDIAGPATDLLSQEFAWRIGHATAQYLQSRLRALERSDPNARVLIVAHDARPHSAELLDALIEGVQSTAMDVIHLGLVDTPMLPFVVLKLGACGGVMATGGSEPAGQNGFVICGTRAMPISIDTGLTGIRDIATRVPRHVTGSTAQCERRDFTDEYREFLRGRLRSGAALSTKTTIVFDACNGVMGRMLPAMLGGIRNLKLIALHDQPADRFEHQPNPTHPDALADLRKRVKAESADFGVAFSPDGAQCAFVDDKGAPIGCDIVAALFARAILHRRAGDVFVFDHRFSSSAIEEVSQASGTVLRERVGPSFIRKRITDTGAAFGADLDGRFYFRDVAGAESASMAVIEMLNLLSAGERSLAILTRPLLRCRSSGELRFECSDPGQIIEAITAAHPEADLERIEGLTVKYPDWRFNIRSAGTPPTLRLTLEARTRKLVDQRIAELSPLLGERTTR